MKTLIPISLLLALASTALAADLTVIRHRDRVNATLPTADAEVGLAFDGLQGTSIKLEVKATTRELEPVIRVFDPSDVEMRLTGRYRHRSGSRKARLEKFLLPATGRYTIVIQSLSASGGEVRIKVKARHPRKLRDEGTIAFAGSERPVPFPAFAGTSMSFKIKGRHGFVPHVDRLLAPGAVEIALDDVSTAENVLRSEGVTCGEMGDYRLIVEGEGDAHGDWRSKIKLRHPEFDRRTLTVVGQPAETFTGDKLPPDDGPDQPPPGGGGGTPIVQTSTFRVVLDIMDPPPTPKAPAGMGGTGFSGRSRFDAQVFMLSLENISGTAQSVQFVAFPWHNIVVRDVVTKNIVWIAYMGTLPVAPTETFAPGRKDEWVITWDIPTVGAPPPGDYEATAVFHTSDPRIPIGATVRFRLETP